MDRLTTQDFNELLSIRQDPCISIYLPVEKVGQDTRQGAIRLRKLVKATADELHMRGYRTPQVEQLLKPAEALYDHALFWEHQNQGLALFISQDGMLQHQLDEHCPESVTIADRFMILPLLAEATRDRSYHLLALSLDDTRLYLGTRQALTECVLPEPRSVKAVIETYDLEKQLQHHGGSSGSVFHGSASGRGIDKQRIEEFFRLLDGNLTGILAESDTPVVIACVDYLYPIFRTICKNSRLMDEHISGSPDNMKKDVLQEKAWQIASIAFEKNKEAALQAYLKMAGTNRAQQAIGNVLPMAFQGRVDALFILRDSQLWGDWDNATGQVVTLLEQQARFGEPDLLSEAARLTLNQGGRVFVLEESEMPGQQTCACLLRF